MNRGASPVHVRGASPVHVRMLAMRLIAGHMMSAVQHVTAEVPGICRVCYDLTPKPVGTVEWE